MPWKAWLLCWSLIGCGREPAPPASAEPHAFGSASLPDSPAPAALEAGEPMSFALLELFTSEGCASCPPADRNLEAMTELAERTGRRVLTLSYHVDYWNDLGWSDPFSDARYSQRQADYLRAFQRRSAYTPELVINGREELVGSDSTAVRDATLRALARPAELAVSVVVERGPHSITARYATGGRGQALVQLALVQARATSLIGAGENSGVRLEHRNVVRDLLVVESDLPARGEHSFPLPADLAAEGANVFVFVFVSEPLTRQVRGAAVGSKPTSAH